jgi:hypothetical protein
VHLACEGAINGAVFCQFWLLFGSFHSFVD